MCSELTDRFYVVKLIVYCKSSGGIQVTWYVYHVVVQHNYTSKQVITVREPAVELLPNRWVLDVYNTNVIICDKWVPVTTAWCVLSLRMEERPPIWRVAANILNKQSRTADEGWSSSLGVGRGANNTSLSKNMLCNTRKARLRIETGGGHL